jgi:hypothetical protein
MSKIKLFTIQILIISVFAISAFSETAEPEDCWVHIKIDPEKDAPGVMKYDTDLDACKGVGLNCEMVRCEDYCKGDLLQVTGGFTLKLKLDNVQFRVKNESGIWTTVNRSGAFYPFNNKHFIVIHNCPTHSELNNLSIDLNGLMTDSQGFFTVFIPSGTY